MNKVKKYLVSILSVVLLLASLAGCGSKSPSDLIVGRWILEEDSTSGFEFFSDGDAIGFNGDDSDEANWSISEDSLKLSNPYGNDTLLFNIEELTKDRLVLSMEGTDQELVLNKDKE
jgi:hypothetical protein